MKWTSAGALVIYFTTVAVIAVNGLQKLNYPKFSIGKTYVYDASINLTARIPGLHSQVSKRALTMKVKIHAEKGDYFSLMIDEVFGSGSLSSVGSDTDAVNLKQNAALESRLKLPIRFFYKDGEVKNYTLDKQESLESQKIKRTILRNLEVYIDPEALGKDIEKFPVIYSVRKPTQFQTPGGNSSSHYTVISSPYYKDNDNITVFNISRVDNFESYDAYETHTNFMAQGCSKVCRKNDKEFDARCPLGYESYARPTKKSFVQRHNLQTDEQEVLLLDSVETKETHVANLYDHSMEVAIRTTMKFKEVSLEKISSPKFQTVYMDLNKYSDEINRKEIAKLCGGLNETEAVASAKTILKELASLVVAENLDNSNSSQVGEKLVLLKKVLELLSEGGLRRVQENIAPAHALTMTNMTETVKRQIWIEVLPVIGTQSSVTFITNIIQENMNLFDKSISIYEASSILNSLPGNIKQVDDKMIRQLSRLLDLISEHKQRGYSLFFSSSHIALARTVNKLCSQRKDNIGEESEPRTKGSNSINDILNESGNNTLSGNLCNSGSVQEFFQHIVEQLASSKEFSRKIIYIETIARSGILEALDILSPFVMGKISESSLSNAEYLRIASIKALHSMVDRYPKQIQHLVKPIYFNQSESFKVRIPAFSVLIRTKPSLGLLQQIAQATWAESNLEVGSYVTSALKTFGNSTLPCGQLLAHRIKKIFAQIKLFEGDYHRSKSLMWSLYDDIRNFGFAKFFQFSANSDSLFPNTLYGAVEYNVDSFRDFILQYSAQMEGVSVNKLYDFISKGLKRKHNEPIPESIVQDIFKQVNLTSREQEPWRMSLYRKMFYSMSFHHIEAQDIKFSDFAYSTLVQFFPYFKPRMGYKFTAIFVHVLMPSSYHSNAVGQAYPSRVQFEMENPILSSMKIEIAFDFEHRSYIRFAVQPSLYSSVIYTNQILSLGDCQNIGVYHQTNAAVSYPVDFNVTLIDKDIQFSYSFPQVPKTVFKYNSGAGTYTGKTKTTTLPMNENKAPIRKVGVPNKREKKFKVIGYPPFVTTIVSEDAFEDKEKKPIGIKENLNYFIRKFRNSGWRNKTIEIKRDSEEGYWIADTKVIFQMRMGRILRNLVSYQQTPLDLLIKVLEIDQISPTDTVKSYTKEALILYNALDETLCHVEDSWHFNISKTGMKSNSSDSFWFNIKGVSKTSLKRGIYHVHSDIEAKFFEVPKIAKGGVDLISAFTGYSNPFSYNNTNYDKQNAIVYFTINFDKGAPFENTVWVAKTSLGYESPTNLHQNNSLFPVSLNMMPETHDECLRDVKEGKVFSVACLKAFRERTVFNKLNWFKTVSKKLHNTTILTDFINQFKPVENLFLLQTENLVDKLMKTYSNISASGRYIDKLYGRPLYELKIEKSNKSVDYNFPVNFFTLPISSMEDRMDTYLMKATNNSYPASCVWMDKHLMTFDMETYSLPDVPQNCSFLMSAHCVKNTMFAVVVKTDFEKDSAKEVTVYFSNNTISFLKMHNGFRVTFNEQEHLLSPRRRNSTLLMGGNVAVAFLFEDGDIRVLEVDVFKTGINFWYDGQRVLLKISPRYKGEVCGMCGNFDGEDHKEFRGLDGKLYRDTNQDFLETFTIGKCFKKEINPVKNYMSPEDPDVSSEEINEEFIDRESSSYEGNEEGGYKTSVLRNIVLSRNDQFCISLLPFPTCSIEPSEMREEEVEFKCFLKSDPIARKWVEEAKMRILMEMDHQECDFVEIVSIPKKC